MKIRTKESGQVLVGGAVAFVVLMGFAGLAFRHGNFALHEALAADGRRCGCACRSY